MKLEEVPQEKKNFKDGHKAPRKVLYVTNRDGSYTQTNSDGWDVENVILEQAWDEIDTQLEDALKQVRDGALSPIGYYLIKNRMDIGILAAYTGKWQWQIKRHLQPSVFARVSTAMLEKYAALFNITIDELKKIA
jgi:hypothetical protein